MKQHYFRNQQESGCIVSIAGCCDVGGNNYSKNNSNNNNTSHNDWGTKIDSIFDDHTDAEIAREMNELSFQEREQVYDDIHGVNMTAGAQEESNPDFVQTCLAALDAAIPKIPKLKRRALDRAFFLRPSLQTDTKFQLQFLRADQYDATKAAKRMVKFFEIKCKLFGDSKIVSDILLEDLEDEVKVTVLSGCCLVLPQPDHSGRPIITFDIGKFDHIYADSMLRFVWYLSYTAIQDNDNAQTKGVTAFNYAPTKRHYPNPSFQDEMASVIESGKILESIPMRVTAYHFCTNNPKMEFLLNMVRLVHGRDVRVRMRTHFGSNLEVEYSLLTFGIHCKGFITSEPGPTPLHYEYLQIRRDKERKLLQQKQQEEERTGIILYPEPGDVLIGRGRPYHLYSGTKRLLELIESRIDEYYSPESHRFLKTCINMEIVKQIEESGGRFLTRVNKVGWKILDEMTAREKTANLFRYRYNLGLTTTTVTSDGVSSSSKTTITPTSKTKASSAFAWGGNIDDNNKNNKKKKRTHDPLTTAVIGGLHDDEVPNKFPLIGG